MQNRIREWRKERNLSATQLGKKVGAKGPTITRLETGKMELTLAWLQKLSTALSVTIKDLLPIEENAPNRQIVSVVSTALIENWGDVVGLPIEKHYDLELTASFIGDFDATIGVVVGDEHASNKYPKGAILICRRTVEKPKIPEINRNYVIQRINVEGRVEVSVRQLIEAADGRLFLVTMTGDPSLYSSILYTPANPAIDIVYEVVCYIAK